MGNRGEGVSVVSMAAGKWKLRWRERVDERWASRSLTVEGDKLEADRLRVEILTALRTTGRYDPRASALLAPEDTAPADLAKLLEDCINARTKAGKYRGNTSATYGAYRRRFLGSVRELEGLGEKESVPVTLLRRELFERVHAQDAARGAAQVIAYAPCRFVLDAWRWAHDANEEAEAADRSPPWHRLPPAPRSGRDYLPRTPRYGRTIAPSLAHVDAVLRRLRARGKVNHGTRIAALLMRFTGLRIAQVFGILREDVDLAGRQLYVRVGKTDAEKADARTVPLSRHLLAEPGFRDWVESFEAGSIFPKRSHLQRKEGSRGRGAGDTLRAVWEEATQAGEVPRHVWAPPNRRHARPDHAFRAAFQAHLEEQRISGEVIDFLVGHEGGIREVHYGRDLLNAATAAVDAIPPVDWTGPQAPGNVVQLHARA